jgi:hypothetical protein
VRVQSKLPKDRKGLRPGTFTLFFTELNQSSVKAQSKLNQSPSLLPFQSVQPRLSSTSLPVVCRHASLLPASQWCAAKPLFYQPPSGVGLNEAATATDLPIHRSTDDLCAAGRVRGCWRFERGRSCWRFERGRSCWRFERGRNGRPIYRSTDPPIHRSTDPPIHRSTDPPIHRSTDPPMICVQRDESGGAGGLNEGATGDRSMQLDEFVSSRLASSYRSATVRGSRSLLLLVGHPKCHLHFSSSEARLHLLALGTCWKAIYPVSRCQAQS